VRSASLAEWIQVFLDAAPVPGVATLAGSAREQLTREVVAALDGDGGEDGFAFPMTANVALASTPS
jgi:hypothetical protein